MGLMKRSVTIWPSTIVVVVSRKAISVADDSDVKFNRMVNVAAVENNSAKFSGPRVKRRFISTMNLNQCSG